jgi:hypothetical protein
MKRRPALLGVGTFLAGAVIAAAAYAVVVDDDNNREVDGPPSTSAAGSDGGTNEGIEVHGHWAITVREPDGSLVEKREFDNALMPSGSQNLGRILTQSKTAGRWRVVLAAPSAANPADRAHPCIPNSCMLMQKPANDTDKPFQFRTLSASSNPTGVMLQGSFVPQKDGEIGPVNTSLGVCPTSNPECVNASDLFSSTSLTPPIGVEEGQNVAVEVEISFS